MRFNVKKYLDNLGVEYIEKGNNVPKDSIAIHCFFCGDKDISEHLAVNYKKGFYYCWICEQSGNIINLVKHLENISWDEAKVKVIEPRIYTRDASEAVKSALKSRKSQEEVVEYNNIILPGYALKLDLHTRYKKLDKFLDLRKISIRTALEYNFYYCKIGRYAYRLIIPVYNQEGNIIGFGARAMDEHIKPKYLYPSGFSTGLELFGANHIRQSEVLILVEGIFDVIRLGNIAVASFTHRITDAQALMLVEWYREGRFKHLAVAYDGDSYTLGCKVAERLGNMFPTSCLRLPANSDPDTLGKECVMELVKKYVNC